MFVQVTELQKVKRRFRDVRATRRNTELEPAALAATFVPIRTTTPGRQDQPAAER